MTPQDNQTIYNLNPLYTAGFSGQGQTIVLVEDTDTYGGAADWNTYRSTFGLASAYPLGSYTQVHPGGCTDPGSNSNDGEAAIDVEMATAIAPSAAIELISCPSGTVTFGGLIALQNLINESGTPPAIVSVSYGVCEALNGNGGNAAFYNTYQQAATEGVSVFVSSGDDGPSSCSADFSTSGYQVASLGVSGWGDTPYNVSVGGTDFEDVYNAKFGGPALSTYWNATNTGGFGSAKSYVPEMPWNDSCGSALISEYIRGSFITYGSSGTCNISPWNTTAGYLSTGAASGGASNCATGNGGATQGTDGVSDPQCQGWPKPSWQAGTTLSPANAVYGQPHDGVRDIPDISMFAANGVWGHFETVCWSDPAQTVNGSVACTGAPSTWSGFGGTSVAAPTLAAIQALVNQKTGESWGNPAPIYYQIAQNEYGTSGGSFLGGGCNASGIGGPATGCVFNDVTQGDIDLACEDNSTLEKAHCYKPSGTHGVDSTDTITAAAVINGGTGYTTAPTCTIAGPSNNSPYLAPNGTTLYAGGSQATCTAAVATGTTTAKWTVAIQNVDAVGDVIVVGSQSYTLAGASTTAIATALAAAINANNSALVTAAASSSTVTITAKAAGYAGNFNVSFGGSNGAANLFDTFYTYITNTVLGQGPNYVSGITITAGGSGYQPETPITLTGGGTGAIAVANTSFSTAPSTYQPAYGAAPGYDLATGLGSVNAYNLVNSAVWYTPQTITFTTNAPATAADGSQFTVAATATSGLAVTFTSAGACSNSGATYTMTASSGTCSVIANQAGYGTYYAAPQVTESVTATAPVLQSQTITFPNPGPLTYGVGSVTLAATATSGLTVTYTVISGPASVSGNILTIADAGTVVVEADQSGNDTYSAASPVQDTIVVSMAGQTITFPNPGPVTFGVAPITLAATSSSGLPITYTVISGPATISVTHGVGKAAKARRNAKGAKPADSVVGSTLTITGAGTVVVEADQAGDTDYSAAAPVQDSIVVNQATPVVTWATPAAITYPTPLSGTQLNATATGVAGALAGNFSYTPGASTVLDAGTQTLSVLFTPTDNTDYTTATQTVSLQVSAASQTITFPNPGPVTFGVAPITLAAYSSSGLPITYSIVSGPATMSITHGVGTAAKGRIRSNAKGAKPNAPISGNVLTITGAGTVVVEADQSGDVDYLAAGPVQDSIVVNQATPVVTWATPAAITYPTPLSGTQLNATASVAGTFTYNPPASTVLDAGTQTLSVLFTPTDTTDYTTATQTVSLQVSAASQTITFPNPGTVTFGVAPITLAAYSDSGLPITYTVISGPATINITHGVGKAAKVRSNRKGARPSDSVVGNTLTITGAGTVVVEADQAGDADYSPAAAVQDSIVVNQATPVVTWATPAAITYPTALSGTQLNATATGVAGALAGNFNYTPAAGAVLDAGTQTLSVLFTPTDTTNYTTATQTTSLQVNAAGQAITFPNPGPVTFGVAPITLAAYSDSGLPITYTLISGPATINAIHGGPAAKGRAHSNAKGGKPAIEIAGSTLTITGAGTVVVEADQGGDNDYTAAAPVQDSIVVNQATPVVSWATPAAITYPTTLGSTQLNATATGVAGALAGNFNYTPGAGTVLSTGAQTLSVTFTPTDSTDYTTAGQTVQLQVNQGSQTINFANPGDQTYGTPLALVASATSGLPVSFTSTTPIFCAVSGTTVTMLNSGSCTVTALQAGNGNWTAATPVSQSFTIHHELQTLTFPVIPTQLLSTGSITLSASASSGLAVTFASSTSTVCTVSGTTATLNAAGTCTITATQAGNGDWAAVAQPRSFLVQLTAQTITFSNPGDQTYGTPLSLVASASSGLPVSFASTSPIFCTVSGTTATMLNSGACTIQATQAGNGSFAAATPVLQSFTVHHELQTLSFPVIPTQVLSTGTITLSASASSGLPVTFASSTSTVCTVSGTTATLLAAGTCTITATQAGNGGWAPVAQPRSFAVQLPPQTISFSPLTDLTLGVGSGTETLTATATSGLTVSFTSMTTAICTVSGNTVTPINSGVCTVQATQAGNSSFAAATPVSQSFTIHHEAQTVTFAVIPTQSLSVDAGALTLSATASSGLAVTFTSSTPRVCTVSGNTATLLTTGTCSILATQAGNGVYAAAAQPRSFTIVP
jgi:hypothetical protein